MASTAEGLPSLFIERLQDIIPEGCFTKAMDTVNRPHKTVFRANTLLVSSEKVKEELEKHSFTFFSVDWLPFGVWWIENDDRQALLESDLFKEHKIYLQNLSSMIPPLCLNPDADDLVLDLAAAPGSKTLQLAGMMNNMGKITAVEVVKKRFYKLKNNLFEHGAENVTVILGNGENIWKKYQGYFDKILIDAPCSTEARFKAYDEETYRYWSMRKIKEMVKKQNRLIFSAFNSLKVGGTMVYSTCSFAPEENEEVISRLIDKFGNAVQIEPVDLPIDNIQKPLQKWRHKTFHSDVKNAVRILPNDWMEGFFLCKITKKDSTI